MALISLAIQIGLALPMAVYFHRISFTGLTANVIIVPLLEAAVPIGFLAIFTGWHVAGGARGLAVENRRAHRRLACAHGAGVAGFQSSAVVGAEFRGVLDRVRGGDAQRSLAQAHGGSRRVLVAALFGVVLWQPWTAPVATHSLELTAIDVGQGDSLLVVFPEGRSMVIDGGGVLQFWARATRRSNLDTGEDVVSPYLWSRGIRRIDILVATHAHQDHSGGLAALLENFRPRELWVGANPSAAVAPAGGGAADSCAGRQMPRLRLSITGARAWKFCRRLRDFLRPKPATTIRWHCASLTERTRSCSRGTWRVRWSGCCWPTGASLHADVLKVGHHGSKTSTSPDFLDGRRAFGGCDFRGLRELLRASASHCAGAACGAPFGHSAHRSGRVGHGPVRWP